MRLYAAREVGCQPALPPLRPAELPYLVKILHLNHDERLPRRRDDPSREKPPPYLDVTVKRTANVIALLRWRSHLEPGRAHEAALAILSSTLPRISSPLMMSPLSASSITVPSF